ncbi:Spy/CpxP family protein refolding chaperone [Sulfurirhabdus autotrophica]|uniref:Spy/CpxP family protein refolding chaperone n=1 Tax=Sulfurirhabdus autotrophica TaxID=1706046 RepID=A0A4R3YCR7_9PROT|nr:periplasmic heavy metal sensor [Sulfurirhabdus autotrophica]TCV90255.1 Spy/CpxP family protein refolding chaperone [Sulfurirhabdus autotrophica]
MKKNRGLLIILWVVLVLISGFLSFGGTGGMGYGTGYGPSAGWGHMGGWGNEEGYRADGRSSWFGMGPGLMGGNYGPGMMSGSGYGWGMRNSNGMMGQYGSGFPVFGAGMGYGMTDSGFAMMPFGLPDLTSEQESKLAQIQSESDERNSSDMKQLWEAQSQLNKLYATTKRDWNAIRAASNAVHDLQRKQLDATIDAQQKIDSLLTDSQRQKMSIVTRGYTQQGVQ